MLEKFDLRGLFRIWMFRQDPDPNFFSKTGSGSDQNIRISNSAFLRHYFPTLFQAIRGISRFFSLPVLLKSTIFPADNHLQRIVFRTWTRTCQQFLFLRSEGSLSNCLSFTQSTGFIFTCLQNGLLPYKAGSRSASEIHNLSYL